MGKRDWTQEELRQLLQEYEASNPDPRAFAKDKQVGLSTLYKLLARAKVARPQMRQAAEIRFVRSCRRRRLRSPADRRGRPR